MHSSNDWNLLSGGGSDVSLLPTFSLPGGSPAQAKLVTLSCTVQLDPARLERLVLHHWEEHVKKTSAETHTATRQA
eukprot:6205111-Pleurochrysis_carterae.AAC.1